MKNNANMHVVVVQISIDFDWGQIALFKGEQAGHQFDQYLRGIST